MINDERERVILARLTARAWGDDAFRDELVANPGQVMEAAGLTIPAGIQVAAVENTPTTQYIVVPMRPDWITDDDLSRLSILIPILTGFHLIPTSRPPGRGHGGGRGGHGSGSSQVTGARSGAPRKSAAKKSPAKKSAAKKSAAKKSTAKKSAAKKQSRKLRGN